jgi:hypothetical protein
MRDILTGARQVIDPKAPKIPLLRVQTGNRLEGSNPFVSAKNHIYINA